MMKRRIVTTALGALAAMALAVGPAAAHPHAQNASGFAGPLVGGSPNPVVAHNGIECAAAKNPNIQPLPGVFFCPSPVR